MLKKEFRISDSPSRKRRELFIFPDDRTSKFQVLPASGRASLGLGMNSRLIICDEPAAWKPQDGELINESILTARGKFQEVPDESPIRWDISTSSSSGSFWPRMLEGETVRQSS